MVANAWAGSHTTFLSFIVLTLDCEYESSGFLTASNDDDLDLSTIAVFHVTGLLLQLYFHSQYWRFGASCRLASIFYCMFFCCCTVFGCLICFKLLVAIIINMDWCRSLPEGKLRSQCPWNSFNAVPPSMHLFYCQYCCTV